MATDVSLAVRHWPAGRTPIVLVHGLASNARMWDGVAGHLAAAGHRVVAVDQRGHGQSDKPDVGYDFATLTDDLLAVFDVLELARPVVVGQSWGGNVVLELGHRHPETVRGIGCIDGGTIELARRFPVWDDAAAALTPPDFTGMTYEAMETYIRRAHADWPEAGITGTMANFEHLPDGTVAPWLSRSRHMAILRELWEHRPSSMYAAIKVPVLLVAASDNYPLREAAAEIPRVRALRVPGDHDIHAQQPDVIAGLLLDNDGFFA